jgi:hypothetical protein
MSNQTIAYTKGSHQANAGVAPTDDGRFQGVVDLSHTTQGAQAERHLVPVTSDSAEEALDEAKALAHRLLSDLY